MVEFAKRSIPGNHLRNMLTCAGWLQALSTRSTGRTNRVVWACLCPFYITPGNKNTWIQYWKPPRYAAPKTMKTALRFQSISPSPLPSTCRAPGAFSSGRSDA